MERIEGISLYCKSRIRQFAGRVIYGIREFAEDENGVGVIEVVLILVVLIGLVAVFKTQINQLLTKIFGSISTMSDEIL